MDATRTEVATMIQRFMRNAIFGAETMGTSGEYKDFIKVRGNLNNLYNKLNSGKRVVISYFGGSVTDGFGASDQNNTSWRGLTFKWLKENFPKAALIQNNRAPGGTGSHYGAFRAQIDLIDPKSDLVFVEFTVNDYYCQTQTHGDTTLYYEQVIRQIREKLPECDIISIFTTDSERAQKVAANELCTAAAAQDIVCEKYGVTSINVGGALTRTLEGLEGGIKANWSKYVTDTVHPADAGYKVYFETIIEYLREYLLGAPTYTYGETKAYALPETYADARNAAIKPELVQITGLDILDSYENIEADPTSTSQNSAKRGSLYATAPDNEFSFTFTGTGIDITVSKGIYIFYSIDGGEMKKVLTFDQIPFRLVRGLTPGKHTITISIKGPTETGANLNETHKISGFFVEGIK